MDLNVECGQQCGRAGVIAHQHDEIDQLVGPENILGLGEEIWAKTGVRRIALEDGSGFS